MKAKPISHRWWFRLALVVCFFVPAIVAVPYDPAETAVVVAAVLQDPLANAVPSLLPIAKILLLVAAVLPVLGRPGAGRVLLGYYAGILLVIAFLQNMAITAQFGFSWLVGNTVVQLVVAAWCAADAVTGRTRLRRADLRWGRLWLLVPMAVALLMPYGVADGQIVPSFATVLSNEAGVTYCMITPVVLGTLLLFPDGVNRSTLAVASFIGLGFGVLNLVVWFGLNPSDWWMGVLHLPLVSIAVFGLAQSRLPGRDREPLSTVAM